MSSSNVKSKKRPAEKAAKGRKVTEKKLKSVEPSDEASNKKAAVKGTHMSGQDVANFATEMNRLTASILRKERGDSEEKTQEVKQIYDAMTGKFLRYSGRHDLARGIQTCFRFGTNEMKDSILKELVGSFVQLSKDRYACFTVIQFLRYGNEKQRVKVLNEFRTHMYKLATHSCASSVLEFAFTNCNIDFKKTKRGKKKQDENAPVVTAQSVLSKLKLEFYGREFGIYATTELATPEKMYADLEMKKRRIALTHLAELATKMAEKGIMRHSFAHSVALAVIQHCELNIKDLEGKADDNDEKEKKIIQDLIPFVTEACLAMTSSLDGASAVARCIAHGNAKLRKKFVRVIKGHIPNLLFHEFGYLVLLTLVNVVDDTVLMEKSFFPEIANMEVMENVVNSTLSDENEKISESRAVVLQCLAPTKKSYLLQRDANLIVPAPETSKKEPEARGAEMTKPILETLVSACDGKVSAMIRKQRSADLLFEVVTAGWAPSLLDEILKVVSDDIGALLEDTVAHRFLKKVIIAESSATSSADPTFSSRLLEILSPSAPSLIQANRPCFVLASLAQHPVTSSSCTSLLKPLLKDLKKSTLSGAQVLVKLL